LVRTSPNHSMSFSTPELMLHSGNIKTHLDTIWLVPHQITR